MKIIVDQDACIGAASCVALASLTFALNGEGKVYILNEASDAAKNAAGETIETPTTNAMDVRDMIIEAARSCPVAAIKLIEDNGTEIIL